MNRIKILGGGIAGLTAAISLKRAGIAVEVHEKKRFLWEAHQRFPIYRKLDI